jgi:bacteriocin-like protein
MSEEKEIQKQSDEKENEKQKELSEQDLKQVTGGAAVDYFLQIGAAEGESTNAKHKVAEILLNPTKLNPTTKLVP